MRHSISTDSYIRSHSRNPKGTGMWGFEVTYRVEFADRVTSVTKPCFTPYAMTYNEAKAWVRNILRGNPDVMSVSVAP